MNDAPLPSDRAERLARAMRIYFYGLIRPLWEDMDEDTRKVSAQAAADLIRTLNRHGIDVTMIEKGTPE
jgi:hypothetical protein